MEEKLVGIVGRKDISEYILELRHKDKAANRKHPAKRLVK
jgi:hypothetical protein